MASPPMASPRMAPSQGNEDGPSTEPALDEESPRLVEALQKLWHVCNVLGIYYKSKIAEFGSVVNIERVIESIKFLEVSRDSNFTKLKELAHKMSEAWRTYNTPISRVENFGWILSVSLAQNAEEVKDWNSLSTKTVEKAEAEITKLTNEWERKMKRKFTTKLAKLKKLLCETHMSAGDLGFYIPTQQVDAQDYKTDKTYVKDAIRAAKEASGKRKKLVLRVEMAKRAVDKKLPLEHCQGLLKLAQLEVESILAQMKSEETVVYDGKNVEVLLSDLERQATQAAAAPLTEKVLSRTRSGNK